MTGFYQTLHGDQQTFTTKRSLQAVSVQHYLTTASFIRKPRFWNSRWWPTMLPIVKPFSDAQGRCQHALGAFADPPVNDADKGSVFSIYSDTPGSIGGYRVVDILANVSATTKESKEFKLYRDLAEMQARHANVDPKTRTCKEDGIWTSTRIYPCWPTLSK